MYIRGDANPSINLSPPDYMLGKNAQFMFARECEIDFFICSRLFCRNLLAFAAFNDAFTFPWVIRMINLARKVQLRFCVH